MANKKCIDFCYRNITKKEIFNKRILEVGSYTRHESVRGLIEGYKPKEYIGIDIAEGRGVDIVCDACDILDRWGSNAFDVLLSTETMEHIEDWKKVIHNFKNVIVPGGIIFISTCSYGLGCHLRPDDFWRYEIDDMKNIFSDFIVNQIVSDPDLFRVLVKVTKPNDFIENDLSNYILYSIPQDVKEERRKKEEYKRKKRKKRKLRMLKFKKKNENS